MARKFTTKVSEGFLDLVETKGLKGYGAINITKRDKQVWAKVYVRYGTIYAIETSTYKINTLNRITMLDSVNDRSRNILRQRFNNNPEDIRAVEAALGQQMAPENELNRITREFFIDSFYEVYQWEQTTMTWNNHEEPKVPTIPAIKPSELIEKVETIRLRLEEDVAPVLNVEASEIETLKPSKGSVQPEGEMRTDEIILISYSEGNSTLREIAYATGRSLSMTKFMAKRLWEQNYINLTTQDGVKLVFERPVEEILEHSEPVFEPEPKPVKLPQKETKAPGTATAPVTQISTGTPAPPPITNMSLFEDDENETTSVSEFFDKLRSPQPVKIKEDTGPTEVQAPQELSETLTEENFEETGTDEFDLPQLNIESLPENLEEEQFPELQEPNQLEPTHEPSTTEEEKNLMESTSPNSRVSSRVAKMVNELKDVLREYRETIQNEHKKLTDLHHEISELHEQRKAIDAEISEKSTTYTKLQKEAEENSEEYKQTVAQLKALQGND